MGFFSSYSAQSKVYDKKSIQFIVLMSALLCFQVSFAVEEFTDDLYSELIKTLQYIRQDNKVVIQEEICSKLNDLLPISKNLEQFSLFIFNLKQTKNKHPEYEFILEGCQPLFNHLQTTINQMRDSIIKAPNSMCRSSMRSEDANTLEKSNGLNTKAEFITANSKSKEYPDSNSPKNNEHNPKSIDLSQQNIARSSSNTQKMNQEQNKEQDCIHTAVDEDKQMDQIGDSDIIGNKTSKKVTDEKMDLCHIQVSRKLPNETGVVDLSSHVNPKLGHDNYIQKETLNTCARIIKEKAQRMKTKDPSFKVSEIMLIFLGFFNIHPDDITDETNSFVKNYINKYLKLNSDSMKQTSLELANSFYMHHITKEGQKNEFFDVLLNMLIVPASANSVFRIANTTGIMRAMLATQNYHITAGILRSTPVSYRFQTGIDLSVNKSIETKIKNIQRQIACMKLKYRMWSLKVKESFKLETTQECMYAETADIILSCDAPFCVIDYFVANLPDINKPDVEIPYPQCHQHFVHPYKAIHPVVYYDLLCNLENCISQAYAGGASKFLLYHQGAIDTPLKDNLHNICPSEDMLQKSELEYDKAFPKVFELLVTHGYGNWCFIAYFLGNGDVITPKVVSRNNEVIEETTQYQNEDVLKVIDYFLTLNNIEFVNKNVGFQTDVQKYEAQQMYWCMEGGPKTLFHMIPLCGHDIVKYVFGSNDVNDKVRPMGGLPSYGYYLEYREICSICQCEANDMTSVLGKKITLTCECDGSTHFHARCLYEKFIEEMPGNLRFHRNGEILPHIAQCPICKVTKPGFYRYYDMDENGQLIYRKERIELLKNVVPNFDLHKDCYKNRIYIH